jgi:hypothetical protein
LDFPYDNIKNREIFVLDHRTLARFDWILFTGSCVIKIQLESYLTSRIAIFLWENHYLAEVRLKKSCLRNLLKKNKQNLLSRL